MMNLVNIEDLNRPVSQAEYIVIVSKTAISVELLFRTCPEEPATIIMAQLLDGMAERLRKDLVTFSKDVAAASRGMKNMGFFDSEGFLKLIIQTLDQGVPNEEDATEFFEYVVNEAPKIVNELPPAGTLLN